MDHNNIDDGCHLIFAEEDMNSDGSDYVPSGDEEDDESLNSDNYDMEIDTFPMSRILSKCKMVFIPPEQPNWSEISVETLRGLIQKHRETETVRVFLCEIDTDSQYYEGYYSDINREIIPSMTGLAAGEKVEAKRYLRTKHYRTMLDYACRDQVGERGEAKIKLILDTAKRYQINMRLFLATYENIEITWNSSHNSWQESTDSRDEGKSLATPLHSLIDNSQATVESLRTICRAWPRIIFIRNNELNCAKTILMNLVFSCSWDNDIKRLRAFSDVLFEAAEKTKEGARGLVVASDTINEGVDKYFDNGEERNGEEQNGEEQTVIHVITTYYDRPEGALPIFLKWWPDALKHISLSSENQGDHPFFNIFRCLKTYESLVKSIEAFIEYSSLDALVACFLYDNIQDGYGFDFLIQALELKEVEMCSRYHVPTMKTDERWQSHLLKSVHQLLQRKDAHGRSLLHYMAAYMVDDDDSERTKHSRGVRRKIEKEYHDAGRDFPYQLLYHMNMDREDHEGLNLEVLLWWKKHRITTYTKAGDIMKWILSKDNNLALSVDEHGLNPLQYAVSTGKKWSDELKTVASIVPDWSHPGNGTLYPFLIAAHSGDDLDTVFELLKFDVSILTPQPGSKKEQSR